VGNCNVIVLTSLLFFFRSQVCKVHFVKPKSDYLDILVAVNFGSVFVRPCLRPELACPSRNLGLILMRQCLACKK